MYGAIGLLPIIVLIRTHIHTYRTMTQSNSITKTLAFDSWMDRIAFYRTALADVSHELKMTAHDRRRGSKEETNKGSGGVNEFDHANELMVDISILYETVGDTVRDVGVRGLLFDVLSDDFEYYVYSDESVSYDNEDNDDKSSSSSDSIDEIHAYWYNCASKHGVGNGCNEWDLWWIYHYIGAILTDMLLENREILWDGSSGETIRTAAGTSDDELDAAMAGLLDRIHRLQAGLPYVTQTSFHVQHSLIWRYAERSSGRLSTSYPWELALNFCRGDGSRSKGIVGRPVGKGIDHECFHGFGHAMFYSVASRQLENKHLEREQSETKQHAHAKENSHMVLRPHCGFELSPESYCEIYELCRGASPSKEKRRAMDPNDEASGNSYRICFEGVVHSVRLLSADTQHMAHKQTAIELVDEEMKRCASSARKKTKKSKQEAKDRGGIGA